jgi:hypothetical protein
MIYDHRWNVTTIFMLFHTERNAPTNRSNVDVINMLNISLFMSCTYPEFGYKHTFNHDSSLNAKLCALLARPSWRAGWLEEGVIKAARCINIGVECYSGFCPLQRKTSRKSDKENILSTRMIVGLESREYGREDLSRWPHDSLYPQKLALTSPTSGGRSVGIVRSWTQATELL